MLKQYLLAAVIRRSETARVKQDVIEGARGFVAMDAGQRRQHYNTAHLVPGHSRGTYGSFPDICSSVCLTGLFLSETSYVNHRIDKVAAPREVAEMLCHLLGMR